MASEPRKGPASRGPLRVHRLRADTPVGHDEVLGGLWRAAERGRLPHALLFEGPDGVGKYLAAEHFVRGLLCASGPGAPCGACGPCKRTASGNFGDLHVLDVGALGKTAIRICYFTLRTDESSKKEMNGDVEDNVDTFLSLKAAEGGWKVVLIRDAERSTGDGMNALLKNLEEPSDKTLLILVSSHVDRLLPTIRSRCVRVAFDGLEAADCARVLADNGLEGERAARLSRWSGGAPGAALELDRRAAEAIVAEVTGTLSGDRLPLVAARRVAELDGDFLGATDSACARHRAQVALDLALRVVLDRLRCAVGVDPADLAFGAEVAGAPGGVQEEARARAAVDALLTARQDVERSMNPDGLLDRGFLALGRLAPVREGARSGSRTR